MQDSNFQQLTSPMSQDPTVLLRSCFLGCDDLLIRCCLPVSKCRPQQQTKRMMAKAPTPALVHEGSPRGTPILFHIDKCEPKHDISDVEKRTWIQSEIEHGFVCSLLSGIEGTLSDWGSPATNVVQLRRSPHLSKPSGTEPNIANLPRDNKAAEMQAGLPPGTPVPGSDRK